MLMIIAVKKEMYIYIYIYMYIDEMHKPNRPKSYNIQHNDFLSSSLLPWLGPADQSNVACPSRIHKNREVNRPNVSEAGPGVGMAEYLQGMYPEAV